MKRVNRNTVRIVAVIACITLVIISLLKFVWPVKSTFNIAAFLKCLSWTITLTPVFWFLFDKYLWKLPVVKEFIKIPDLSGRWRGIYKRTSPGNDGREHEYVLEITQKYSSVRCNTFQDNGSNSYDLLCDLLNLPNDKIAVAFYWYGEPHTETETDKTLKRVDEMHGFSRFTFTRNPNGRSTLKGSYFTDRGTYGEVQLEFEGKELSDRF